MPIKKKPIKGKKPSPKTALSKSPSKSKKSTKKLSLKSKKPIKLKKLKPQISKSAGKKPAGKKSEKKIHKDTEIYLKSLKISPVSNIFKQLRTIPKQELESSVQKLMENGLKEKEILKNISFILPNKEAVLQLLYLSKEEKKELIFLLAQLSETINKDFLLDFSKQALEKRTSPYIILTLITKDFKQFTTDENEFKNLARLFLSIADSSHCLKFSQIAEELSFYKPLAKNKELLEAMGKVIANISTYTKAEPEIILKALRQQAPKIKNVSTLNEILFMFASLANSAMELRISPDSLLLHSLPAFSHITKDKITLNQTAKAILEIGQEAIEQGRDPNELLKTSLPAYAKKISSIEELQGIKSNLLYI